QEYVGVARVEDGVGATGVFGYVEDLLPRLSAIRSFVQPAVAAGAPQRALCGDVDGVGVARVEEDLADVLGLLQSDLLPGLPAVGGFVNAVAVADGALAVVLAGADPDGAGIFRVQLDVADGVGTLAIEDRRPGDAGVGGLPDPAGGHRDVVVTAVVRVDGEADDAAGEQRRADRAQAQPGEDLGRQAVLFPLGLLGRGGLLV